MRNTRTLLQKIRRLALTTKQTNKGYYKGTGTGSTGRHTQHGGYVIEWQKVRTYVCPPLENFSLTPFVTKKIRPTKGRFENDAQGAFSGQAYLEKWKSENGQD